MKTTLPLSVCFCLACLLMHAQQAVFTKSVAAHNASFLLPDENNGTIIVGETTYLSKLNNAGQVQWSKQYAFVSPVLSSQRPIFTAVARDQDSNIVVTGATNESIPNAIGFIMKLKKNGDTIWCRKLTDNNYQNFIPRDVSVCKDTGYIICGVANSTNTPSSRMFAAKFTKNGMLSWSKTYTNSFYSSQANAIRPISDSGFIFTGSKQITSNTDWDVLCGRLSNSGQPLWAKQINYTSTNLGSGDQLLIQGSRFTVLINAGHVGIVNMSLSGTLLYETYYNLSAYKSSQFINETRFLQLKNKHLLFVNKGTGPSFNNPIMEADTGGLVYWIRIGQGMNIDAVQNQNKTIDLLVNRGPALVQSRLFNPGLPDFEIFRLDSLGNNKNACLLGDSTNKINESNTMTSFGFSATASGIAGPIQPTLSLLNMATQNGCLEYIGGIGEHQIRTFQLSPNPSFNKLSIRSDKAYANPLEVRFTDLNGKEVYSCQLNSGEVSWDLELPELTPGFYVYSIHYKNQSIQMGKHLVQPHR